MLQGLAHHAGGDPGRAAVAVGRALVDTPEPDGHVRLYLDEGPAMLALLRDVADPARRPAPGDPHDAAARRRARRLLDRAGAPAAGPRRPLADPLSQRELDVLRMLDSELTGPQIARQLYVSINTLRTHTRRIFTKLDATTRTAAVRRAHERGLL
jgi:LuxR family maltose regulon positive regulatory protein